MTIDDLTRLRELVTTYVGRCAVLATEPDPTVVLASGDPTPEQQTTIDELLRFWRSGVQGITLAEWQALDAAMADDRAFRQQTRAQFLAKTQAQQARELFDVATAHSKMLRALIRDN